MPGYTPLDLAAYQNAGADVLKSPLRFARGDVVLRGIPFRIGSPDDTLPYVRLGPDGVDVPMLVDFEQPVQTILVAHLLLDSVLLAGGPAGHVVATYTVHMEGGGTVDIPIRELFEIGALAREDREFEDDLPSRDVVTAKQNLDLPNAASWAWRNATPSLLAYSDSYPGLHPRRAGTWRWAVRRLEESRDVFPGGYRLWVWRDPDGRNATGLEIRPTGTPFVVAGITVGDLPEDPIIRTGREPVTITLLDPAEAASDGDLQVGVDRGVATYAWPLLPGTPEAFLSDEIPGWGQAPSTTASPAYAEVAATPSATLEIRRNDVVLGSVRWSDVIDGGVAEDAGRVRIEWVDRTRNWVHTTVVDEATGAPVPCRIHFRSPSGVPWQPHGHNNHVNADLPAWGVDVGGDTRLGAVSYALIDGRCQGWLPEGDVLVEVVRGFEYEPLRERVRIEPGQRDLRLSIRRWVDLRREGWLSGDTHVHFPSVDASHLEAAAEDLHVVNLLQMQVGHLFANIEDFSGRPSVSADGETIVYVGSENRQGALGHMGLLGLQEPIMPWSTDGAGGREGEVGGTIETTLSHWADAAHAQGGLVVLPHFNPAVNGEAATLIATGRIDAVEMVRLFQYPHEEYYRYLNAGYRLPLVGGTDKMTNEVPAGICRTYVRLDDDEPFTYETWTRNLTAGRTFLSSGPILHLRVEGKDIGDTVRVAAGGGTVDVEVSAESAAPFEILQLVVGGRVAAEASAPTGTRKLALRERLKVDGHTWIAARAGGPAYYDARRTLDAMERGVFAHTSPIYVACGDEDWSMRDDRMYEYLLTRVDAARTYVRDVTARTRLGGGGHPHGEDDHLAFLERPFLEARERLLARLKR